VVPWDHSRPGDDFKQLTTSSKTSNTMPSIVPHRRARDDEDEDHEEEPRSANKRARPNGRTSTAERHSGVSFHENAAAALQEHQPGAIVRVKLTDFVTYTAATFYPGPALNMVIGPNGTGKSTLVCAICLGLASSPSNLGRAKDVGEFVKHGASEAYIELELKGRRGQRNQIITTHIKKEGNKRTFSINGTSTTQKAVVKLANEFSIQIDNLCQFLPQDRVVEFAGLNPVDLLASTQRAAAPQQMIDWHEQLKKLRATQRTAEVEQGDARKSLTDLQKKQDNQRIDVERLRERAEVVKNISMLEKVKQLAESVFLKDAHSKAKDVRTAARIELADLTAEVQPTLQAKIAKEEYVEAVNKVFKSRSSMYERFTKQSEAHLKEAEAFSQKIKACEVERRTEKDNQKLNKQKAAQIQTKIRGIKAQMQQEPVEFDLAAVQEKGRELGRQAMELTEEVAALRQSMQQRQGLFVDKKERLARAKHDLEGLRTQAGQQANRLAQRAPDAAKLLNFVKEKGDRFSAEVFGPPLVECHVTNNQFTDIIESLLNEGDITQAFTVQNQADFKTLNTIAFEELRLTQISIRLADRDMNHWRQQRAAVMSDEQIRTLGIDGWALDYLAGPDPVLSMLCKDSHMHETPIMKQDHDDAKYNILSNMNLRTWFAGSKCYKITKRREYGISAGSVKAVAAARFWTTQPVDTRHEADLRDNIEGWGQELQELSQTQEGERLKSKTIQSRLADVDAEKVNILHFHSIVLY
jgi:energy-coupling factor transporter ATP-binding protein EcfA2